MAYASEVGRAAPGTVGRKLRSAPRLVFVVVFFVLMLAPLLAHLAGVQGGSAVSENRRLADPPKAPRTAHEILAVPKQVDAYLNDHFGLRRALVEWSNRVRYHVFGELTSPQLTVGKNGFIFFNSHNAADPLSLVRFLCGQGISQSWIDEAGGKIGTFVRDAVRQHPASTLMIVPTKTVLYAEHMPDWAQEQCRRGLAPVPRIAAALAGDPQTAPHVQYPFDAMMAMKASFDVFPPENFHWEGEGPRRVAERLSEGAFGMAKRTDLPARDGFVTSDVQHFVPGVRLDVRARIPDYAAAGIAACDGAACFPELGDAAGKLGDVSRYRGAPPGGPKLLVVSDSFGHAIAGYFSQYFAEVWHLSTNNIDLLTPDELRRVKEAAFQGYAPDRILYLYHDFATGYFTKYPTKLLGADAPAGTRQP